MNRLPDAQEAKERIQEWGRELGLSAIGVAPAKIPTHAPFFLEWLRRGYQASMHYLSREPAGRFDPQRILEGCRSVLCVALHYGGPEVDPAARDGNLGRISRYAWGDDYHDILKEKLKNLSERIEVVFPGTRNRVAVDTSPVLEKAFAAEAGLGWVGKHTNLIDGGTGSWFFLGEVFTTMALPPDQGAADRCGPCVRCIEACPTGAIVEPYRLDARRCLAYWNIEHRGEVDRPFHAPMGNWIFGCDICQEVCPWNHGVEDRKEERFAPRAENLGRSLTEWHDLPVEDYRIRFRRSPVKRASHDGLCRNISIARANRRSGGGAG